MKTYKIAEILNYNLMSRPIVRDLHTIITNTSNGERVAIDFSGVYFATRSFADEFYINFAFENS